MSSVFAQPKALPTCIRCGGVLTGSWTEARGKVFHPECFRCDSCDEPLGGIGIFVRVGSKVFCKPCRMQNLGKIQKRKPLPLTTVSSAPVPRRNNNHNPMHKHVAHQPAKSITFVATNHSNNNSYYNNRKPGSDYIGYTDQRKTVHLNNTGWEPQQATQLNSDYKNRYNPNTDNVSKPNESAAINNENINMQNNVIDDQQYNMHMDTRSNPNEQHDDIHVSDSDDNDDDHVQQASPQEMAQKTQMTQEEIDDWNDFSTANKPRDFIGFNDMQKKQDAKESRHMVSDSNGFNDEIAQSGDTDTAPPKAKKKKKFKLFGR